MYSWSLPKNSIGRRAQYRSAALRYSGGRSQRPSSAFGLFAAGEERQFLDDLTPVAPTSQCDRRHSIWPRLEPMVERG